MSDLNNKIREQITDIDRDCTRNKQRQTREDLLNVLYSEFLSFHHTFFQPPFLWLQSNIIATYYKEDER